MEIDESKFGAKRKYKRGRVSEGPRVFGVVERGSQKHHEQLLKDIAEQFPLQ